MVDLMCCETSFSKHFMIIGVGATGLYLQPYNNPYVGLQRIFHSSTFNLCMQMRANFLTPFIIIGCGSTGPFLQPNNNPYVGLQRIFHSSTFNLCMQTE